jgi:hypothetical protein
VLDGDGFAGAGGEEVLGGAGLLRKANGRGRGRGKEKDKDKDKEPEKESLPVRVLRRIWTLAVVLRFFSCSLARR